MKRPRISVIIPTYNSKDIILDCLLAIMRQTVPRDEYEVIVVDDGSTDSTAAIIRSIEGVRLLSISHGGPSKARNEGVKAAAGDLIVFTDSDCSAAPDWLEKMTSPFSDEEIVGVKGVYRTRQKELVSRFVQLEYQYKYERMGRLESVDFIDTYSAAYRKEVFLANGGFDTSFTVPSVEDQELSFRLAQKGYRMVFARDAAVYHKHDRSLKEYWNRKFGIGFWKAFMLRWIPQKTFSDSHTSPSQRYQIMLFAAAVLTGMFGGVIPAFFWGTAICLAGFFLSGLPFWLYIVSRDIKVGLLFPVLLIYRAVALGAGLGVGLIKPPQYGKHAHLTLSMDAYLFKRFVDILGSLIGLLFSLPIILCAAIAIRLDSPGPIFFYQYRAGENGKPFRMVKLRTMVVDAEERLTDVIQLNPLSGPVYKIPDDPRVTRIGRRLRRWSLDELPQFWNILKGDMSLVGPRPEEIWVVVQYNDEQRKRLAFKPGLTGPMQINGRGNLSFEKRLQLEIEYMQNYTFLKDIQILLRSVQVVIQGRGAH